MSRRFRFITICIVLGGFAVFVSAGYPFSSPAPNKADWGFFGHKRINRLAVFTLPEEMLPLYKTQIEYITEHAVDPDKRRYATKHEAVRHYIDIDHWGSHPFDNVPRKFTPALIRFSKIVGITATGDTLRAHWEEGEDGLAISTSSAALKTIEANRYRDYFYQSVMPRYYDGPSFTADALIDSFSIKGVTSLFVIDDFSQHGILPYNLISYYKKLVKAFSSQNYKRALRLSTEVGHYLGDAHVPLHTTTNYNGQLTDQVGIHGFWESRIPELFADATYDYFVGQAEQIDDMETFIWDVVLASNLLVDSVLQIEKRLSKTFPADQQYCFEDRNNQNIRTPCEAYARAFTEEMEGMVEERFRASIHAIGSFWYTAWLEAGKPPLHDTAIDAQATRDSLDQFRASGKIFGRQHDD